MDIKTKYNIGDKVEFRRESVNSAGKKLSSWAELGIIKSVSIDKNGRYYFMEHGYQGSIKEDTIMYKLQPMGD